MYHARVKQKMLVPLQVAKTPTVYSVKSTCTLLDVSIADFQQTAYRTKVPNRNSEILSRDARDIDNNMRHSAHARLQCPHDYHHDTGRIFFDQAHMYMHLHCGEQEGCMLCLVVICISFFLRLFTFWSCSDARLAQLI